MKKWEQGQVHSLYGLSILRDGTDGSDCAAGLHIHIDFLGDRLAKIDMCDLLTDQSRRMNTSLLHAQSIGS